MCRSQQKVGLVVKVGEKEIKGKDLPDDLLIYPAWTFYPGYVLVLSHFHL